MDAVYCKTNTQDVAETSDGIGEHWKLRGRKESTLCNVDTCPIFPPKLCGQLENDKLTIAATL